MPIPGPVAYQVQSGFFTAPVISTGFDQVAPSSVLLHAQTVPRALALAVDDPRLGILTQVVGHEQPNRPSLGIDHWTGIAAGVAVVVPDDLRFLPGLAAVAAPPEEQVDRSAVVRAVFAALTESQQRSRRGQEDRRNAVGVIPVLSRHKQRGLHQLFGSASGRPSRTDANNKAAAIRAGKEVMTAVPSMKELANCW